MIAEPTTSAAVQALDASLNEDLEALRRDGLFRPLRVLESAQAPEVEIGGRARFEEAIRSAPGVRLVVADASGGAWRAAEAERIRLLVGPEGGWTAEELAAARGAGAEVARFGAHVMRIETAAVVACGMLVGG